MKLTWHDGSQQWSKVIGKRPSADGERLLQAQFYLGPNRDIAAKQAMSKKEEWRQMKKVWGISHRPYLKSLDDPFADIPHWYSYAGHGTSVRAEQVKAIRAAADQAAVEDMAYTLHEDGLTLSELSACYLGDRLSKVGVDRKAQTVGAIEENLKKAFSFIDSETYTTDLTAAMIDEMRTKMIQHANQNGKSLRSVRNYGDAIKYMLDWYWKSDLFQGGTPPVGIAEVFEKFPKRSKTAAEPKYLTNTQLKHVLGLASPLRLMYLLLMLNTGMQPADIAHIESSNIDYENKSVIWKRKKNERESNPSRVILRSVLWPETLTLIERFAQKTGLAFRKLNDKPLFKVYESNNGKIRRKNAVSDSLNEFFQKVRRSKGNPINASGKNLRQTAAQRILEIADYDTSRMFLGRDVEDVDRSYVSLHQSKLNDAVMKLRANLKADAVF